MTAYDPGFGTGNLLAAMDRSVENHGLQLYGQELDYPSYLIGRFSLWRRRVPARLALSDSLRDPAFADPDGALTRFDLIVANPMWNQHVPAEVYADDDLNRFVYGTPPAESADWGWAQHLLSRLQSSGRMALALDREAVSRGSESYTSTHEPPSNAERVIRQGFVNDDLIEAVMSCSPGNSGIGGNRVVKWALSHSVLIIINKNKAHSGQTLFIDASSLFGRLPYGEMIDRVVDLHGQWRSERGLSVAVDSDVIASHDFDLNPARYL